MILPRVAVDEEAQRNKFYSELWIRKFQRQEIFPALTELLCSHMHLTVHFKLMWACRFGLRNQSNVFWQIWTDGGICPPSPERETFFFVSLQPVWTEEMNLWLLKNTQVWRTSGELKMSEAEVFNAAWCIKEIWWIKNMIFDLGKNPSQQVLNLFFKCSR